MVKPVAEPVDNGNGTSNGTTNAWVASMLDLDAVEVVVTLTGPYFCHFSLTNISLTDCETTHLIHHELEERGGVMQVAITELACDRFRICLAHFRDYNAINTDLRGQQRCFQWFHQATVTLFSFC